MPDDFAEERLRALYDTLVRTDDPGQKARTLSDALALTAHRQERARVLSRLIMYDGTIESLVDPRGALPVTFGVWLRSFHQQEARELERREIAAAVVEQMKAAEQARTSAADETAPVEIATHKVDVDMREVGCLLKEHNGHVQAARASFSKTPR